MDENKHKYRVHGSYFLSDEPEGLQEKLRRHMHEPGPVKVILSIISIITLLASLYGLYEVLTGPPAADPPIKNRVSTHEPQLPPEVKPGIVYGLKPGTTPKPGYTPHNGSPPGVPKPKRAPKHPTVPNHAPKVPNPNKPSHN
ncbi:MAG: hypothetical protein GY757_27645 [bacterium]|nr:hypothetical protein [bacterium]